MKSHEFSRKKATEERYLAAALQASSIFPAGQLISHEKPDFLLQNIERTVGIEVTELCMEASRAEEGRLAKVAEQAQRSYSCLTGLALVEVRATFAPNVEHVSVRQLVSGLTDFVVTHQKRETGSYDWKECQLPEGYCYIGIHKPLEEAPRWWICNAFDITVAPRGLLDACIQKKNRQVKEYRLATYEIWLLIINDKFLGAGEVHVRPDQLIHWDFDFEFDKVLLFTREIGGADHVTELRHSNSS